MNTTASTSQGISRRGFLGTAALGLAGLTGASLMTACSPQSPSAAATNENLATTGDAPAFMVAPEPIADQDITNTMDTDVLVIGAGISGACTAASAVENGLSVIMIEKADAPRAVGLDFGLINPQCALDAGVPEQDPYELTRDHVEKSMHLCRVDKVYRFMTRSGAAGNWLVDKVDAWGLEPQIMAYASKSDHYANNPGIVEFWHKGVNLAEEEDCYLPMAEILAGLAQQVIDAGSQVLYQTEAVQLVREESGRVTAAFCKNAEGYVRINATRGVVLASGDYAADEDMVKHYCEIDFDAIHPDFYAPMGTGTGDGQKMGLWIGAQMQKTSTPFMLFRGYCYHYLRTNALGQRYVNEDSGYTGTVAAQLQQPQAISWAIWDDKWREEIPASLEYAGGMAYDQDFRRLNDPWTAENEELITWSWEMSDEEGVPSLFTADSLEELAGIMGYEGESLDTFLATVKRYNELCDTGDEDFGKRPELMSKIEKAPFYCLRMPVEVAVTVGGLLTNADSECLDEEGRVIPGLFAVGNAAGGLFGDDYNEVTVPGISVGRSLTFGWLLGQHLAK
ncbi:MAG: FAD-dependent oxidoreductase [Adlercreutzia sp.]|nr:FAD-dependent oxidoreductase [Adlercreutzia sp.]